MRRIWLVITALLFAVPGAHASAIKIPEWGDAAYYPWQVFPEAEVAAGLRDDVIVVFHGFKSAMPNGTYKRLRPHFTDTHSVLGFNYDYFDTAETVRRFTAFARERLAGRRVVLIGTSLGGFWANYFGNRIDAHKVVVLNPVTEPDRQLRKYVGQTVFSERRNLTFGVAAHDVAVYEGVRPTENAGIRVLAIVTEDDEKLDYRAALGFYRARANAEVALYDSGGHTLDLDIHPAIFRIIDFIRSP